MAVALAQFRAVRFYDPATGQFLTRDPADAATRSAYGYVYGNPLNGADPTGMLGMDDLKHAVNTGIKIATGGAADCVMGATCEDGATNASGICTIGLNCTDPSQRSIGDEHPALRTGLVVVAIGALTVAGFGAFTVALAGAAGVSVPIAIGVVGALTPIGVGLLGGLAALGDIIRRSITGDNCTPADTQQLIDTANALNDPGTAAPDPGPIETPTGVRLAGP